MQPPSPTLALGIFAGLAAAILSAVSYLISRHYGNRAAGGSVRLLVFAHVLMGLASLPLIWLLRPDMLPPPVTWLPPLLGSALCYLVGQAAVFAALKQLDASRLAPLLGLKIAMLAVIVSFVLGHPLDMRQWLAVALSVAAAAMLQRSGAPVPRRALGIVVVTCFFFAVSDLCIVGLIDALQTATGGGPPPARLEVGAFAMAVTYASCGAVAACFVPWVRRGDLRDWGPALQYATAWMGAMVALYTCFGLVGAVFGNILQSTRGVMAVGIGAVLAHLGWHDLEQPLDREVLLRRLAAAILMTAAIALYAVR